MSENKKGSHQLTEEPPPHYGIFQGVINHPPPTANGFPQPVPPPGASGSPPPPQSQYYAPGYETVPGYTVAEGRPVRERRLPCCGCGLGWFLFIIGFFLAAIPWYVAAILLMCSRNVDPREKPGYVACTIAVSTYLNGLSISACLSGCNCGNIWSDKGHLMEHNRRDDFRNRRMQWFCKAGLIQQARRWFDEMMREGCSPNVVTYTAIIHAYLKARKISKANELFELMLSQECPPNIVSFTALIDGYCKAGDLAKACAIYEK